ncbi:hypothetical protein BB561_004570, partial [Smittium simulii]
DATTRTLAKCGKSAAMVRLRQELSLTDLNIKAAVTKTRTFMKWADLRTWISDLIKCPYKNICDTWHMLLECSRWQALRADILAQYIHIYTVQVATKPPLLPASISMREVKTFKYKDLQGSDCTLVKTTLKTSNFLNAIALPRYLMLNSIILASIPSNQCPPDDAVVLAESSDKLQIALDVITKWPYIHKMAINSEKYGVISVNCIPTVMMLIITYGSKIFCMGDNRTKTVQMMADKSLRDS